MFWLLLLLLSWQLQIALFLIHYGLLNVNKQQGPTSHQISDMVQKILNINKAGHSGTLEN